MCRVKVIRDLTRRKDTCVFAARSGVKWAPVKGMVWGLCPRRDRRKEASGTEDRRASASSIYLNPLDQRHGTMEHHTELTEPVTPTRRDVTEIPSYGINDHLLRTKHKLYPITWQLATLTHSHEIAIALDGIRPPLIPLPSPKPSDLRLACKYNILFYAILIQRKTSWKSNSSMYLNFITDDKHYEYWREENFQRVGF